jgi:hypothetical protein
MPELAAGSGGALCFRGEARLIHILLSTMFDRG